MDNGAQMSGPLNSNEIEDVVSSVRRLVSVDVRQRPAAPETAVDRLVLTPSLRVVAEKPDVSPLMLTERAVEGETLILQSGHPEPATADPDEARMAVDVEDGWVEDGWEDDLWSDPDPALAELALAAEEAELVTSPDDVAVGSVSPAARTVPPDWITPDWDESGPDPVVHFAASAQEAPEPLQPSEMNPEPALDPASPDLSPVPPVSTMPQTLTDTEGNPLTVMDEAALHDIIRQLIREELKGALGERITHNVRKLVRAEINRALTARSLD